MKNILVALLLLSYSNFSLADSPVEEVPSPCDEKLEKKIEKENDICEAKKQRSEKVWPTLESAKNAVIKALSDGNSNSLKPYIGCDSTVFTLAETDVLCLAYDTKIKPEFLDTFIKQVSKNKYALDVIEWNNYGVKKDIYLLCSKKYQTRAAPNYCKNKELRPMIEIRKSAFGYYIFGIAVDKL